MDKGYDENRCHVFHNFVEEKEEIWFWDVNCNALFHGSANGGIMTGIWGAWDDEDANGSLYSKIVKYGHKIIGIPMLSDNILVYDISTGEIRLIPIPAQEWGNLHTLERGRFWDGVVCGNYIFMIGFWSAKILKFDVVNECIIGVVDLYEGLGIPFEKRFISFKNALVIEGKILIPSYTTNCIFAVNTNNMDYEKKVIKRNGHGFSDIAYDGENIWLSPRDRGQIVKWNIKENRMDLYDNYPAEIHMEDEANISGMGYCNGKVYIFPYRANKVFYAEKTANDIEMHVDNVFNSYYEGLCTNKEVMKYLFVQSSGKQLYSFCMESRKVLSFNTETGRLSELKFLISEEDYICYCLRKKRITEEGHSGVSLFLKILTDKDKIYHINKEEIKHSIGEEIYNRIKRA